MDDKLFKNFNYEKDVSLKGHSTFKIGGKANFLFKPQTIEEFINIVKLLNNRQKKFHIIGRGSNILFSDIMKTECIITTVSMKQLNISHESIMAECGVSLRELCYTALMNNFSGMEGLSGIPGTVGGAVYMNAGAYGYSIDQIFDSALVFDTVRNSIHTLSKDDCHFSYRKSTFTDSPFILLKSTFKLNKQENNTAIKTLMSDLERRRSDKQPLNFPSAGSVFKKPYETFYPAKEIQELGLKGFRIGDACISEKHSGFIINLNQATAEDVLRLIKYVQEKVFKKTGEHLHVEIKYLD